MRKANLYKFTTKSLTFHEVRWARFRLVVSGLFLGGLLLLGSIYINQYFPDTFGIGRLPHEDDRMIEISKKSDEVLKSINETINVQMELLKQNDKVIRGLKSDVDRLEDSIRVKKERLVTLISSETALLKPEPLKNRVEGFIVGTGSSLFAGFIISFWASIRRKEPNVSTILELDNDFRKFVPAAEKIESIQTTPLANGAVIQVLFIKRNGWDFRVSRCGLCDTLRNEIQVCFSDKHGDRCYYVVTKDQGTLLKKRFIEGLEKKCEKYYYSSDPNRDLIPPKVNKSTDEPT